MKSGPLFVLALLVLIHPAVFADTTALDDYVYPADPALSWTQYDYAFESFSLDGGTGTGAYAVKLTSQSWRDASEVTPTVWTHWVTVIIPDSFWADLLFGPVKDTALILINDGTTDEPMPIVDPADPNYRDFRNLAFATRTVIVELRSVPNQPLQFADETFARSEDEIIAYSWDKFLTGGDPNWPVQLPMVKSVVACMDMVQDFVNDETGDTINHFVLAGGSKRGWTAWLTAAVDGRVTAIAPIVSDLLNMKRSFAHHWASYGFWADALSPYEDMNIFDWFDTPQSDALLAIVDPYEYRDRLDIPKFIVTAAGDDFFVHDSIQFYLDDLLNETYVRTEPNTNHYLEGAFEDVFSNMVPYYDAFINGNPRPQFDWTLNADGSMTVTTVKSPLEVILWQADNSQARDFRQVTIGKSWRPSPLTEQSPGVFVADPGVPLEGWRSYFVELVYDYETDSYGIGDFDFHFTTEMRVIPEVRPFETDLSRDRQTGLPDVMILANYWLTDTGYYDILPRRTGDGIINMEELSLFSLHWLESQ